ncbi:MAG: sulfotransferase [Sulfuriferula sp.]
MALEVIGAGFGRTGTLSAYTALKQPDFPCYHMFKVLENKENKSHLDFWRRPPTLRRARSTTGHRYFRNTLQQWTIQRVVYAVNCWLKRAISGQSSRKWHRSGLSGLPEDVNP